MPNSRAKFVQNFFGFYRFFGIPKKIKNDRKRSRINGLLIFNMNDRDEKNALGRIRTHAKRTGISRAIHYTTRAHCSVAYSIILKTILFGKRKIYV